MNKTLDCLIIGGGPAGLTAAIYLGRFRRRVLVVDKGWSRAEWITLSHNLPGYPQGVAGPVLLGRLREQAQIYGAVLHPGTIESLRPDASGGFVADMQGACFRAQTTVLCTGVVENKPPVPHFADAVKQGLIRTCPICDGYECIDKSIAVLGDGEHAAAEALFLKTYTSKLWLLAAADAAPLSTQTLDALGAAGIEMIRFTDGAVHIDSHDVTVLSTADGSHRFDAIYSAYGTVPQAQLGDVLGAKLDESGRVCVDLHQETSVRNLFAAGDLVRGLNQISVADGEAAIAATAVHNRLPKARTL